MKNKLVVYTVVIGGNYELSPTIPQDGVDYICFTDQPKLEHNGWTVKDVLPILPSDTFRSSRDMKIRPHRWLANYSNSIYIDSTVHLHKDPLALWNFLIPDEATVFGGFFHSFRETIADEFMAVTEAKLDFKHIIDEQFLAYRKYNASILNAKPVWGGILARRHNSPFCIDAMEIWFANILRYSRRDQLSLPLALTHVPRNQQNITQADIHLTDFHKWPVSTKPKPWGYTVDETNNRIRMDARNMINNTRKFARPLKRAAKLLHQKLGQLISEGGREIKLPKGSQRLLLALERPLVRLRGSIWRYGFEFSTKHERMNVHILRALKKKTYEASEIDLIRHFIEPVDRVVEIGICVGATSLVLSEIVASKNIVLFEADPRNAELALHNFHLNGMKLDLRQCALLSGPDRPRNVTMYSAKNASSSSLIDRDITEVKFTIETAAFEDVIEQFRPTAIVADIEGGEIDLFSQCEDFGSVRKILLETHARITGQEAVDAMIAHLAGAGFKMRSSRDSDFIALTRE